MSFPQNKPVAKLLKWIGQVVVLIALFVVLSKFLAKDMLDTKQAVPSLSLGKNATLLTSPDELLAIKPIKDWNQSPQHLIYFFAPWCTICALSQPSLEGFALARPNTQIIMVALDWETAQTVTDFKQKHQFELPLLLGNQELKRQWQVDAYPSYYFVDNKGKVTSKDRGLVTLPGLLARAINIINTSAVLKQQ